jgi:hypothetical protein
MLYERVRGSELDIVQFCSFDNAPYTAVFREFRTVTESVLYFHHVCLSDRLSASISAVSTGRIDVKLDLRAFMNSVEKIQNILKWEKRDIYMKIKVCFIVAGNIKLS